MKAAAQNKIVDLGAGSENILRVHHRNMVHARYLQNNLNNLDAICKRNLNRVQQEIYNVYYSEFLPLRESKKKIEGKQTTIRRSTKRFGFAGDGRIKQKCVFPDIQSSMQSSFRSISTVSVWSRMTDEVSLPPIFGRNGKYGAIESNAKHEPAFVPLSVLLKLSENERNEILDKWKEDFERCCPSVVSRAEQNSSPNIDSDRLKIIKSAIALSSQPAPNVDLRKHRKLRKSFLVNLRKKSRVVWTGDVFKDTKETNQKGTPSITRQNSFHTRNNSADSINIKFKPSFTRNRTMNHDNDISKDDQTHGEKLPPETKSTLTTFSEANNKTEIRLSGKVFCSSQSSPDDYSYYSSSPDFFSEIDEEPSSYEDSEYDGSSYIYSTDSSFTEYTGEYTDDISSVTEDEAYFLKLQM